MKSLRLWVFTLLLVSPLFLPMRMATAQLKATLEGHTDHVWSVAFSPDGKTLASGSWDQTVRLWDIETEQLLHLLTGHTDSVNSVAFSLDGRTLASGSWDGTIRLWNPHTGGHKRTLTGHTRGVTAIAFSPDRQTLASGSADQTIRLWNATTWQLERTLTGHTKGVDSVAFSPDGATLASGSRDRTIRLWNPHTGQHTKTLTGHTNDVLRMVFSPDGATLASGGLDKTIRLWNPHTGQHKTTLAGQTGWVNPVAFSPDGATLAIGNRGISLWDTDIGQYKVPLTEDIGEVVSVVFSPDGQTVASGSADNLVRLLESTPPEVPFTNIPFDINNIPEPVPPPAAVRDFFDLTPFYQQWINVAGFSVLASAKVNPYALKEATWVIWQMIGHRPDILKAIAQDRQRLSVLSINESLGDLPEFDPNSPLGFLQAGDRDIVYGGITTAAEEVLFCSDSDYCYSFLIHEFAHTIHRFGLNTIDPTFDNRLKIAYDAAIEKGLWKFTYAASKKSEYWAEGVGSWFNAAYSNNPVKTRDALKAYDPSLALLIAEIFGDGDWRYTPPVTRMHLPHLQGFNPQEAFRLDGLPLWKIRRQELEEQLKDPNSDGDGKWVNLPLYHPSLLPSLIESTTRGDNTAFLLVTVNEISFYLVNADGTEHFQYRSTTRKIFPFRTYVGVIWLIKDHNGEDLAVFRAEEKVGRVLVTPALTLIKPGLSKISGDNQKDLSGTVLVYPLVIEVRDENLSVLEGISVTFTVTTGDGTLSVTNTTTDENGRAESILTLGPNLGTNTVSVSAAGIERLVTFYAVAEAVIDLPDPNLRAAIENALLVAAGAPITASDMAGLTRLEVPNANISDLTGLEHATNLTDLWLDGNNISDISALAGLTNLTSLSLWNSSISDISALAGLTNLTDLWLDGNNISDISPLVANTGLGEGDEFVLNDNPLSSVSIKIHILALQSKGVTVEFDNQAHPALLKISGDNQTGASFVSLSQPFVVEAQDENGSVLAGDFGDVCCHRTGGGTLSTTITRTDENGRAQSTLILGPNLGANTVQVSATGIRGLATFHAIADTELPPMTADANNDGLVNILDLILIASSFGQSGQNETDVNGDGIVSILDLVLAAGMFDGCGSCAFSASTST